MATRTKCHENPVNRLLHKDRAALGRRALESAASPLQSVRTRRRAMKVGIVGAGRVGCACALALVGRGCAQEIVLVDRTRARAEAVATDIRYGLPPLPRAAISAGAYEGLARSPVVLIPAGGNEETGGATSRR